MKDTSSRVKSYDSTYSIPYKSTELFIRILKFILEKQRLWDSLCCTKPQKKRKKEFVHQLTFLRIQRSSNGSNKASNCTIPILIWNKNQSWENKASFFFQCKKYEPNQILLMQVSLKRRKTCQWYHLNKYVWNKENKRKLILN